MRQYLPEVRAHHIFAMLSLAAFVMLLPPSTNAQSGSKQTGSASKATASNTAGSSTKEIKPALEGYCPVCIVDMKKWVKGNAEIKSTFDGQTYLFPGQEQKATFDANPAKYTPVLGGDCTVAYKKMGQRVPGDIRQATIHNDRLFLFSNEMAKNEFAANTEAYANVDLALGGKCTVCKIEMQKDIDGKPEFAAFHQGVRYYFPGEEQRAMFLANPAKYAVSNPANQPMGSGSAAAGSAAKRSSQR